MKIIKLNPTSPGRRNKTRLINKSIHKGPPLKSLCFFLKRCIGRNNSGKITVRHKSLGCKKKYRILDFYRYKENIIGTVKRIEYDPNRSANIALINYEDNENSYIISPKNLNIGDKIISSYNAPIKDGNFLPLKNIPCGTKIHCLELIPRKGSQLLRSAGCYGVLVSKKDFFANIILKSGELRKFSVNCRAAIGEVGNEKYNLIKLGKAGTSRLKGIRPTVRGVAMNPIDHPHGGGEGKTSGGRDPVSPWGFSCKGLKTKKKKNIFILKGRLKKTL